MIIITPIDKAINLLNQSSSLFTFQIISESCANLIVGHVLSVCLQSAVYNMKRNGARTVPCGAPVLLHTSDVIPFKEINSGWFVK